jgi:hypothetical protein
MAARLAPTLLNSSFRTITCQNCKLRFACGLSDQRSSRIYASRSCCRKIHTSRGIGVCVAPEYPLQDVFKHVEVVCLFGNHKWIAGNSDYFDYNPMSLALAPSIGE